MASSDSDRPAPPPRPRERDDDRSVLPERSRDDEDRGWGDEGDQRRGLDWYRRERPPHHE